MSCKCFNFITNLINGLIIWRFIGTKQNLIYCNNQKRVLSILLLQIYTIISLEKIGFRQIIIGLIQFQDFVKFNLGYMQFFKKELLNLL